MEVQTEPLKEVLGELFALLEAQETNALAILQFLKEQGIATDEKLAPYVEQAGNASSVKWRAARKRMEFLLTPIQKETAEVGKAKEAKAAPKPPEAEKDSEAKKENQKREEQAKAAFVEPSAENRPHQKHDAEDGAPKEAKENKNEKNEKGDKSDESEKNTASKQSA